MILILKLKIFLFKIRNYLKKLNYIKYNVKYYNLAI
jgi:hypothetical protein